MDNLDVGQFLVTVILAIGPWMFPEFSLINKAIFALLVITVSLLLAYVRLCIAYAKLQKKHTSLSENHKALVRQYEEKQREIEKNMYSFETELRRYYTAFQDVGHLIVVIKQSTKQDRLSELYTCFEKIRYGLMGPTNNDVNGEKP